MKPIQATPNRSEQVYASIRDSICEGTLKAGTHLVQEDLAARLGVSRQPVQQAMVLLKNHGLVLERGSRGLYVAPVDALATVHRYQIRMAFDQLSARLCAKQAAESPEFAESLLIDGRVILAIGNRAVAKGMHREAVDHDVAFHNFLYERSGNPLIGATLEPLWHYLRRVMITVLSYAQRGPTVWQEHQDILETLAQGDTKRGVKLVTDHIKGAQEAILGAMADMPSTAED